MKVIAFNASPRKQGNTALLINKVLGVLEENGVETRSVSLAGSRLRGCTACMKCFERRDRKCAVKSDALNEYVGLMAEADGIILGSPSYFANVTAEMKALIDRAGLVAFANPGLLRRKAGAAVAAARRVGSLQVLSQLNGFFSCFEMFTVGSNYPNMALGMDPGDVASDAHGMETMRLLGENMAFLLGKLRS